VKPRSILLRGCCTATAPVSHLRGRVSVVAVVTVFRCDAAIAPAGAQAAAAQPSTLMHVFYFPFTCVSRASRSVLTFVRGAQSAFSECGCYARPHCGWRSSGVAVAIVALCPTNHCDTLHVRCMLRGAGSYADAIRAFETVRGKKETELAAICGMMYFHIQAGDRDAAASMQADMEAARERATPAALILAATFFWHINDIAEARRCVDRVLSAESTNKSAQSLRGWIDLSTPPTGRGRDQFEKSIQWFDGVLGDQEAR
jgi:hypothetical protein